MNANFMKQYKGMGSSRGHKNTQEFLRGAIEKVLLYHTAMLFSCLQQNFTNPIRKMSFSDINYQTSLKINSKFQYM